MTSEELSAWISKENKVSFAQGWYDDAKIAAVEVLLSTTVDELREKMRAVKPLTAHDYKPRDFLWEECERQIRADPVRGAELVRALVLLGLSGEYEEDT